MKRISHYGDSGEFLSCPKLAPYEPCIVGRQPEGQYSLGVRNELALNERENGVGDSGYFLSFRQACG